MSCAARIVLLLLVFSVCAGGTILVSMHRTKKPAKHATPTRVLNREVHHRIWLRV